MRRTLPEPSSGFRPGDLLRLVLAISFLFLIVLAIVRFRNPATWQWVRNITVKEHSGLTPAAPETGIADSDHSTGNQDREKTPRPEVVYELGQLGLALAGFTAPIGQGSSLGCVSMSLLSLDALAYATPADSPPLLSPAPKRTRHVLLPDMDILRGARDREPFLIEPPSDPTNPYFSRERQDADARYHLIQLVLEQAQAGPEGFLQRLHQDARWQVPYELLRDKPRQFRGEVIGVRGTLVWIKRFALERGGRGSVPEYIYHGILEQDGLRDRPVWILFTAQPTNFPPEKDWSRLFLDNTVFVGYYLKVVEIDAPPDPRPRPSAKPRPAKLYFPVLVGYTVELPPPPPQENWLTLLATVAGIVGGIVVVAAIALYLYYRSERPYMEKMARVRQRVAERGEVTPTETNLPGEEFRLEDFGAAANNGSPARSPQPPSPPLSDSDPFSH